MADERDSDKLDQDEEEESAAPAVAVVTVPRNPTARSVARMLEGLKPLGMYSSDHTILDEKMDVFRCSCVAELRAKINEHASRYGEGVYRDIDSEYSMQDRINVALTFAIYLIENVERVVERAIAANNTAVFVIAEKAVSAVSDTLSDGFFDLEVEQVTKRVLRVEPLLLAGLNITEQHEYAIPVEQIYPKMKEEAKTRILTAMDEIFSPEET